MLGRDWNLQHLRGKAFTTQCLQGACRVLSLCLYCVFWLCTLVMLLLFRCRFVSLCMYDSLEGVRGFVSSSCPGLRLRPDVMAGVSRACPELDSIFGRWCSHVDGLGESPSLDVVAYLHVVN